MQDNYNKIRLKTYGTGTIAVMISFISSSPRLDKCIIVPISHPCAPLTIISIIITTFIIIYRDNYYPLICHLILDLRFLDDPSLSIESCTDLACNHEVENYKPGYENCSADKIFLDCQLNQENIEMAFKSNLDLPLVEQMDVQESSFDCLNKGFGFPLLTSILV